MKLGKQLYKFRKKKGLSQEMVASKLNVSRQTISKWELDETVPDLHQAHTLAKLYNVSLDDFIKEDNIKEIEEVIKNTNEQNQDKINWTKVWSKKYPVLATYQNKVDIPKYAKQIRGMLTDLSKTYNYNNLDAMLVLKDILAHTWKSK